MLGDASEAARELAGIPPARQNHPDVLELRFSIHSEHQDWTACLQTADALFAAAPDRASAWIHRSYALHELQRTQEAWDALYPVREKFPDTPTIPYNLACYACQLGHTAEALAWLQKSFDRGGEDYRRMALEDADLEPLWPRIPSR